jgi:hypothetical protein
MHYILLVAFIITHSLKCGNGFIFPVSNPTKISIRQQRISLKNKKNDNGRDGDDSIGTKSDMNPLAKSVWYGVEKFGQIFAPKSSSDSIAAVGIDQQKPPSSLEETVERIKLDNDRCYFLSGNVDEYIYDDDCIFADPFVSFSGKARFVENLKNLAGGFITKYDAKVIAYTDLFRDDESQIPTIETKIMVKLELNLPWKPVLAWPWGVTYKINPNNYLITDHIESWQIEPIEGIKQIFRPPTVQI